MPSVYTNNMRKIPSLEKSHEKNSLMITQQLKMIRNKLLLFISIQLLQLHASQNICRDLSNHLPYRFRHTWKIIDWGSQVLRLLPIRESNPSSTHTVNRMKKSCRATHSFITTPQHPSIIMTMHNHDNATFSLRHRIITACTTDATYHTRICLQSRFQFKTRLSRDARFKTSIICQIVFLRV